MSVMSIDSNDMASRENSADPRGRGQPQGENLRASPSDEEELNAESKL